MDEYSIQDSVVYNMLPDIAISPDHGLSGSNVEVDCTGFTGDVSISIYWDYGLPTQQLLISGSTNSDGNYSGQFTVPTGASNGVHTVTAVDVNGILAQEFYYVGPHLYISPSEGVVGTNAILYGETFPPNSVVSLYWDGGFVTDITTGGGDFNTSFPIPEAPYGLHLIEARNTSGTLASTNFTVLPAVRATPDTGNVNNTTTITGTGFSANSIVYIYWDTDITYRSEITNAYGSFTLVLDIPETPVGVHDIVAIDRDGHWALTNYIVLPHIELNRSTGHVGDRFTVYAHGFSPTVPVTLVWDGVFIQFYSITDNRGFVYIEAVVPLVSSGTY